LQNIKVLAVDQVASQENEKPAIVRAVTLEVTPDEAELVVKAMQEGTLQLTLRNPLDSEVEVKTAKLVESIVPPSVPPPVQTVVQPKIVEKKPEKKRVLQVIPWDRPGNL
jgi:pilus assembly protein CpaB